MTIKDQFLYPPIINLYCDESCHLEHDIHKSMVIGGISCSIDKIKYISNKIKALKVKHGLRAHQEIKWIKVSKAKEYFYLELDVLGGVLIY